MKTRRRGSSSACVARQACLRTATSGRSCSLACAVFFERHGVAIEEAPNHALCKPLAVPTLQMAGNLRQRDVASRSDQPQHLLSMGLDPIGALVATCGRGALLPVSRQRRTHFTAVDAAIPNRSAAARRLMPPATASISRSRRSLDRGLVMQAGLLCQTTA